MKKKILVTAIVAIVIVVCIQIGRYAGTYPVSTLPIGKGIGSTLYIASYEPYHPYLEEYGANWFYLFQAPLGKEEFDDTAEKIIFKSSVGTPTHMNILYSVETYRANLAYSGAEILSQETLLWKENTYIQKGLNALAPKTSEESPLYLVWCEGNLYGVIDKDAYLLWRGKGGKLLLSLPEFQKPQHTPCVISLGPITEDDYYEAPASIS